jgi:uncharacterized repeat protein (TIGR03803 family)
MRALSTLLFIGFFVTATFAISEQVLYTFSSPGPVAPYGGLIPDGSGNFYGTTVDGGLYEFGAVYEISPSAGGWVETTLYSFSGGSDGAIRLRASLAILPATTTEWLRLGVILRIAVSAVASCLS